MSRAFLEVSPVYLERALFPANAECPEFEIVGATWDPVRRAVLLSIVGDGVPDADRVVAVIHSPHAATTVTFEIR